MPPHLIIPFDWPHLFGSISIIFAVTFAFIILTVWLHCRLAKASFNSSVPILDVNHGDLFLVCVATDQDEDSFARYFSVRYGLWLLSLSVLEV